MNIIKVMGKYVDQPLVVAKFSKAVPIVLGGGAALYTYQNIKNAKDDKKKVAIKNLCVLSVTAASALVATRGFKPLQKIFKNFDGLSPKYNIKEINGENTEKIKTFLQNNKVTEEIENILHKAKTKILNPKEIKELFTNFKENKNGKKLLEELIPEPEAATAQKIRGEIGRLSALGLVPVLGGISGGIIGDRLTEKNWKERIPNKIKEGSYQYLANIFLCNVGAGVALGAMEKMNIKSKGARALGMIGGIIAMGVVGGSAIANFISNKCIDPFLGKNNSNKKLYSERKPEALDVGLHVDDIATVSVLSGLRWIEPALPILYSISGYRAGIGYRNGENNDEGKNNYQGMFHFQKLNLEPQFSKETFKAFS